MSIPRIEYCDMDGCGDEPHAVYDMPPPEQTVWRDDSGCDWLRPPYYWDAVTDVPCPVEGCDQTVVWYEAGYVPGYRVCMQHIADDRYDADTIRHRFQAGGTTDAPTLTDYAVIEDDD